MTSIHIPPQAVQDLAEFIEQCDPSPREIEDIAEIIVTLHASKLGL